MPSIAMTYCSTSEPMLRRVMVTAPVPPASRRSTRGASPIDSFSDMCISSFAAQAKISGHHLTRPRSPHQLDMLSFEGLGGSTGGLIWRDLRPCLERLQLGGPISYGGRGTIGHD